MRFMLHSLSLMASMWLTRSKWQRTMHSIMVRIVGILYLHFDVARGRVIVDMHGL